MPDTVLNIFIGRWRQDLDQVWFYAHNLIRIVDKAVFEYEEARSSYLQQVATLRDGALLPLSALFRSVAHMETCIHSVRRALRFIDRLKSHKGSPAIPRTTRKIINSYTKAFVDIRDIVEHMDEMIADGRFVRGRMPMLMLTQSGDGVSIADKSIQFDALASLLRELKKLAKELSEPRSEGSPT